MSDRVLVDTNILVYAYDRSEAQKQQRAIEVLNSLVFTGAGVLSTQILAEFFVSVTRKITIPLSVDQAVERIENYLRAWRVVDVTGMIVLEAARGVRDHQLNFWDAQIWATARLNQISIVYTEDFNVDSSIEGVQFVNPLSETF